MGNTLAESDFINMATLINTGMPILIREAGVAELVKGAGLKISGKGFRPLIRNPVQK